MIYYLLSSFIIILFSFFAGCLIKHFCDIDLKYVSFSSPLGFFCLLALLQLGYYFIIFNNFDDRYFTMFTIFLFAFITIFSIFNIKIIFSCIKKLWNSKFKFILSIIIFAILFLVFYFVKFNYKLDDINFYGEYIPNRVGGYTEYNFSYIFTGIYIFFSVTLKLSHYLEMFGIYTGFYDVGFVIWVPAIIGLYFFSLIIVDFYDYLKSKIKSKKLLLLSWIFILGIVFLDLWYFEYPHFGVTFRRLPLIYLLYVLEKDAESSENSFKRIIILTCLIGASFAISSSGFFISMIILYCYFIYHIFNDKKGYIFKICIYAIIPIIFACKMFEILTIPMILLYVIVFILHYFKKDIIIESLINKIKYVILFGVPLTMIVLTYVIPVFEQWYIDMYIGDRNFFDPINHFDMVPDVLNFRLDINGFFNIIFWLSIAYYIYKCIRKKQTDWNFWLITALLVTFYNPFVYTFIGTGLTSVAYFRISDIFYNIVIIGNIAIFFFNDDNRIIKKLSIIILGMLFVLKASIFRLPHLSFEDFNHIYHVDNNDIEVMEILERDYLSKDDKQSYNFASQIYGAQLFTNEKIDNLLEDRFAYIIFDSSEFERVFYRRQPGVEDVEVDYTHACGLALSKELDYVIIDAQYNWKLQEGLWPCAEVLFEHENYRVLKMNYDYYNYNLKEGIVDEYIPQDNN